MQTHITLYVSYFKVGISCSYVQFTNLLLKKCYLDESENTNCITVNDRCNRSVLNY